MRSGWVVILLMMSLTAWAADSLQTVQPDRMETVQPDRMETVKPDRKEGWLRRTLRSFGEIDTAYVEPQHYNWALMLQSINTYDYYRLGTTGSNRQSLSLAPTIGVRMGPYFGWRWVFLGYTFDLRNFNLFSGTRKLEIDASIYSAQIGADVFYRRSVDDYKIRRVSLGRNIDTMPLEGLSFDGLSASITGFNLYYIFNHKRFSYPAAFAQSTRQKMSCGSWMAGIGYTHHSVTFDYAKMESVIRQRLGEEVKLDSGLMFNDVKYRDISASVGYSYNWVFARNFLLCSSLALALAYKSSTGETATEQDRGFDFANFNVDGIARLAIVWNNDRFYAGASAVARAYNYRKSRFAANNIFGDLCIYMGLNFGARKAYKKMKNER